MEIDGEQKDLTLTETCIAKSLRFIQESVLFQCSTTRQVAYHTKIINVENGVVEVSQSIDWIEEVEISAAYLSMLPVRRKLFGDYGEQITDYATTNIDAVIYNVSEINFKNPLATKRYGVTMAKIWGETSGIYIEVESIPLTSRLPNSNFYIIANIDYYNKLYFDFCGNYTSHCGEK